MMFHKLRRTGVAAGLCAAVTMIVPAGVASASISGQPTPMTVMPRLAAPVETAAVEGTVEVAQNRAQRRRAASRRQFQRQRNASRRQFQRQRRATRRQIRRGPNRLYRNGRYYYYRNGSYYDNNGGILAGALIGLAAGAIASQAVGNRNTVVVDDGYARPYSAEWYRQCDRKYRSFRASDGTYLGYDGVRHVCRVP